MSIVTLLARKGHDAANRLTTNDFDETFDTNFIAFSAVLDAVIFPLSAITWARSVRSGDATTREAISALAQYIIVSVAMTLALAYKRAGDRR